MRKSKKKLGIYIHIPFCVRKCDYCDFLSAPANDETKDKYVKKLLEEITKSENLMKGYKVDTVFIGGGTPSSIRAQYIFDILACLRNCCEMEETAEITIECNPGTLSIEKLEMYKKAGINRLSIGLQTANNRELHNIGRIHTWEDFEESYENARACGFDNINVDLMSALPGQSVNSYVESVNKVLEVEPEHISAYSLIVEEGTTLADEIERDRCEPLPDEDSEREMYYLTESMLREHGYERYEISNYCKQGYECKHNLGYWKRKEYLGFGIGAASLYNGIRLGNLDNLMKYLGCERVEDIRVEKQTLTQREEMEEFMFLGLRLINGISTREFKKIFEEDYNIIYGDVTKKLVQQELLIQEKGRVKLTRRGIDISNVVLSEFLF